MRFFVKRECVVSTKEPDCNGYGGLNQTISFLVAKRRATDFVVRHRPRIRQVFHMESIHLPAREFWMPLFHIYRLRVIFS